MKTHSSRTSNTANSCRSLPISLAGDLGHVGRGFLMGGADIIPGVSGGTVALILGIYGRLVAAISHFDLTLWALLRQRQWAQAARHVDLRFLLALGAGILLGVGGLASTMHFLLHHHLQPTFAAFFGLILGSSILVARRVERWNLSRALLVLLGAGCAFWLLGLPLFSNPPEGLVYLFFCGAVAICAMILPGISGAFILLILGAYAEVTGLVKDLLHGQFTPQTLVALAVFLAGCAAGLLSFSKGLRWLLNRYTPATLAVLCGFMVGSLRKLWPFKADLTPKVTEFQLKRFANVWPGQWELSTVVIMVLAVGFVFALDWLTKAEE